jgi:DNA-directed RNA polymerase specialized sigma24 family protein
MVHGALDQLPTRYGNALEWKYVEGASVREIAGRLQLGAKATESLLTRARAAFREVFNAISATHSRMKANAIAEGRGDQ